MSKLFLWVTLAMLVVSSMSPNARGQDPLDRDSWNNVAEGDWGNDDNWIDDLGDLSAVPTTQDDRWALVDGGIATVSTEYSTSGLTIGSSGTVNIVSGGSLEVALTDFANSVGQTQIDPSGTLHVQSGGSYKALGGNIVGNLKRGSGWFIRVVGKRQLGWQL